MYHHILVPTDGSAQSIHAAEQALQLADEHDARLTLLTVVRAIDTGSLETLKADELEHALQDAERQKGAARLDETMAEIEPPLVDFETDIVAGTPHRAICDYVESTGVDLVVLGTVGHDSVANYILGSTTKRITQLCDVSVLVV